MRPWSRRQVLFGALIGMSVTGPGVFGLSTLMLRLPLPQALLAARLQLQPVATWMAWWVVLATPGVVAAALALHRPLVRRMRLRQAAGADEGQWTEFSVLAATASLAQLPALAALCLYVMGAAVLPIGISVALSTAGVFLLWPLLELGASAPRQNDASR